MKTLRATIFTLILLLFTHLSEAARSEDLLSQQKGGGWKGGDKAIVCDVLGATVAAGVKNGKAVVIHSGKRVPPLEITYTPYGFVFTGGSSKEGASYTVVLTRSDGGPRLIWAPFGPEYVADDPIGLGLGSPVEKKCKWGKWQ